jgi:hypothetical protein
MIGVSKDSRFLGRVYKEGYYVKFLYMVEKVTSYGVQVAYVIFMVVEYYCVI